MPCKSKVCNHVGASNTDCSTSFGPCPLHNMGNYSGTNNSWVFHSLRKSLVTNSWPLVHNMHTHTHTTESHVVALHSSILQTKSIDSRSGFGAADFLYVAFQGRFSQTKKTLQTHENAVIWGLLGSRISTNKRKRQKKATRMCLGSFKRWTTTAFRDRMEANEEFLFFE